MIERLSGEIVFLGESFISLQVFSGIVFSINTFNVERFSVGSQVDLFIFFSWNQDRGPSLIGFSSRLEREVFTLLISCPKIGAQTSLQILSGIECESLLSIISSGDEASLKKINGIGPKAAKNIVSHLQDKASDLILKNPNISTGTPTVFADLNLALINLGYSSSQVSQALKALTQEDLTQFDVGLKKTLSFLAKNKNFVS